MARKKKPADAPLYPSFMPLWQLRISEVQAINLETRGRKKVNELLQKGWILLHVYTVRYKDEDVWRERPMAVLGKALKTESTKP